MASLCPCCSGLNYNECCAPYHRGEKKAESALILMRSRYCAYARCLPDYIMATTDPTHFLEKDHKKWKEQILSFCKNTLFEKLEIISSQENNNEAFVTFKAFLKQNKKDASFTEKSHFKKVDNSWYYIEGTSKPNSNRNNKIDLI